jgi:hypothetical protein
MYSLAGGGLAARHFVFAIALMTQGKAWLLHLRRPSPSLSRLVGRLLLDNQALRWHCFGLEHMPSEGPQNCHLVRLGVGYAFVSANWSYALAIDASNPTSVSFVLAAPKWEVYTGRVCRSPRRLHQPFLVRLSRIELSIISARARERRQQSDGSRASSLEVLPGTWSRLQTHPAVGDAATESQRPKCIPKLLIVF